MAIGVVTHATPGALGVDVTEGYLTQPMLLGTLRLADGALVAIGTLNLEGLTLRRGEINPGVYGEGFIDRRHPHTYLHEAILGTIRRAGPLQLSVFAGKGFVPSAPMTPDGPPVREVPG
ncbi:MAG: hypothetical protein U5L72_11630 [Bacteroidales bacterium]|nr:hypothetical protein [Bacteroidales bacterium]